MATCDTFAEVLSILELDSYWPCKISLRHVFAANLNKTLELKDIKWHILNKIISVDLRARDEVLSNILEMINNQVKQTDTKTKLNQPYEIESKRKQRRQRKLSLVHPQDVLNAIYMCCSPFLKQVIVSKLLMCRIAVPVIIQSKQITAGFFWPFDFVATEGTKSTGKCIEGFLSDQDIQIVSFIRLHRTNFSKSDFLNNVLSKDPFFHTFYSRNSPLGTNSKRTFEGTVEASHFVPFGKKKTENFDDVVLFLNLRGDAQEHPLLVDVIKSVSNVVVVLLQIKELLNDDKALEVLLSIFKTCASIIIALESSSDSICYEEEEVLIEKLEVTAKTAKCDFNCIELKADGNFRGMDEIVKETRSDILRCLANTKYIRLSTFSSVVEKLGLPCDFASTECIAGCQNAEKLYCMIDAKSTPVQQLWIKLSQLKKKKYRERVLQTKRDIEKQIHQIRTEQQNYISNLPKMSLAMLQNLFELKDSPHRLMFFLKHLKLLLDKRSKKILPNLLTMYNDLIIGSKKEGSNNDQLELQIKRIKIEIEEASFGVEHLMREVAQIFEVSKYASDKKWSNINVLKYVENCPSIAANLLIEGYPLEVMDGAASDIPLVWIKQVLSCLESKIGSTAQLLTLSIMGIQSSGKSTLLNAMFGLQLAVSTGRCTKGIFLQLIPMPKDQFPFQYVLVFDTEGLRSNEHRESMVKHEHDNQIATFVVGIGDVTLINIRGENMSEVSDILEIVVHAFIRMKKVNENFKLKQSCVFVHQDVAGTNAKSNLLPGTLQLVKCLDEITNEAAEQEHLADCHSFDEIIYFNHEKHVFYFPNLWRGTPPLCAINTEYSENVDRLRRFLLADISERRNTYFSVEEICSKVGDLWEAILSDDFIFSFRNGVELKAERAAESKISELHRKLENTVSLCILNEAEPALKNCEQEHTLDTVKSEVIYKLREKLSIAVEALEKEWIDFIEDAPLKDILIQWKENRLNQLRLHRSDQDSFALNRINEIESEVRIAIRQKIILTPEEKEIWKHHATQIAEKCITDNPLDDDIKTEFEKLFSAYLSRFKPDDHEQAPSIKEEILKIVQDYFRNDEIYLTKELEIFETHQSELEEGFEKLRELKGCIMERHLTEHLSGKKFDAERKNALSMANDVFSDIDIFLQSTEIRRFSIIEIREIFDKFLEPLRKCDNVSGNCSFSFSKKFKAMLAVYICKYLISFYQRNHGEYEKKSGIKVKREEYKSTVFDNFRKLILEAMKLISEKIMEMKEEEKRRMEKEEHDIEEINKRKFQVEAKLIALQQKAKREIEAKRNQLDMEIKDEHYQSDKEIESKKKKAKQITSQKEKELKKELTKQAYIVSQLQTEEKKSEEQARQLQKKKEEQEERVRKQDKETALSITNIIKNCIISHVSEWLKYEVINEIIKYLGNSKGELIRFLMKSLAEREDFEEFNSYLNSTTSFVKKFIKTFTDSKLFTDDNLYSKLAENKVSLMIDETKNAIKDINSKYFIRGMDDWSGILSKQLKFIFKEHTSSERYKYVSNYDEFTNCILGHLIKTKESCISHFREVSRDSVTWPGGAPYQRIFESLWGCKEKCPFCFEPCQFGKNHPQVHSCMKHRPTGVAGWRNADTHIISIDPCEFKVASDIEFYCNTGRQSCCESSEHVTHKYRNYKTFPKYKWDIQPDNSLSSSKYWTWFLCRFEEEIICRYDVKYPDLPLDWRWISKEEAIQSLN